MNYPRSRTKHGSSGSCSISSALSVNWLWISIIRVLKRYSTLLSDKNCSSNTKVRTDCVLIYWGFFSKNNSENWDEYKINHLISFKTNLTLRNTSLLHLHCKTNKKKGVHVLIKLSWTAVLSSKQIWIKNHHADTLIQKAVNVNYSFNFSL